MTTPTDTQILDWLGLFYKRSHDVERRSRWHPSLFPSFDRAHGDSAEVRELLGGKPALCSDRFDSRCVVHDRAVIREDDGLAVGRCAVVDGDFHSFATQSAITSRASSRLNVSKSNGSIDLFSGVPSLSIATKAARIAHKFFWVASILIRASSLSCLIAASLLMSMMLFMWVRYAEERVQSTTKYANQRIIFARLFGSTLIPAKGG